MTAGDITKKKNVFSLLLALFYAKKSRFCSLNFSYAIELRQFMDLSGESYVRFTLCSFLFAHLTPFVTHTHIRFFFMVHVRIASKFDGKSEKSTRTQIDVKYTHTAVDAST